MNEVLTWTLIIIAVGMTIQFVVLSLRHENLLREHTRAIRELTSNNCRDEPWDFTEKVKGIYKYVQIIAWIGIFFCVCVCVHYLCGYCPREKSSTEADYIGVIVGILAALITLLVGWQIFSTIKAKEELHELQNVYNEKFSIVNAEFAKLKEDTTNDLNKAVSDLKETTESESIKLRQEIWFLSPLFLSAHNDLVHRLSVNLSIFKASGGDDTIAKTLAREYALQCLSTVAKEEDTEVLHSLISEIKEKCKIDSIRNLYAEFCTYSEEELKKYEGVNNLFLELLKDS